MMILICYSLNVLHNTVKSLFALLHFSFSSCVKVCISCTCSQPKPCFITVTSFYSESSSALAYSMLKTSISKLMSSMYQFSAAQLNTIIVSAGPPCLCLYGSACLITVFGWGPASVSLSIIITTIAAWPAIWFTISLIFSDSAIVWLFHNVCFTYLEWLSD